MSLGADGALEQARRLLEPGASAPEAAGDDALALAWALKALCYEAWNSEPTRAARAAEVLRSLSAAGVPAPVEAEIQGLVHWTEGIAFLTRGQMGAAVQALDLAAQALQGAGLADPAAQTQVPKIMALSMLGRNAEAAQCGEDTLRQFQALGDLRAAGKVSLNLGSLHLRLDAYALAARYYRQAAVWFARVGDHEHSVMADGGLADAFTSMGDFDEALRVYARGRMRAARHELPVIEAMFDESVALLELARGRYREALAGFESSRRRYEQLGMPQHLAIAEKQLADAYLELRLVPEALGLFEQVLKKFEALDMPVDRAWTASQRGRAQAVIGLADEAAASLAQAAELFAAQGNRVGGAAVSLARAELALGADDAAAAGELAALASTAFASAGRAEGCMRADTVQAFALLRAGEVERAGQLFDATLAHAREQQVLPVQVRCLTGQGLVARERGEDGLAQAAFEASIELFEDQRSALPGDDIRSAFLSDHLLPYRELLRLRLGAHERGEASGQAVLREIERVRARTLGERLGQSTPVAVDDSARDLRARLNWLYRRTQHLDDDEPAPQALQEEMRRTERDLLERVRRQRLTEPLNAGAGAARSDHEFSVELLQRSLAVDDALVEYAVLDDELLACVVTAGEVRVLRRLASWAEVTEALRAARFQIETLSRGAEAMLRHLPILTERVRQRLQRLHALVWAPLASALSQARRVAVVPHDQLGSLPFAALNDGQSVLAERHQITVAASARLLLRGLARQPVISDRALALGESSRLPHAAGEAQFVASQFPRGAAYVGEQASIATLREHARGAGVIHLACHAEFRSDNPMFSALHLADGALSVEETERLVLEPGVVVLSACETGLSDHAGGDEMLGLVRAFLVAGAARVMASLWPVDDQATAAFMACLYSELQAGRSPAQALQAAQLQTMATHPHPFYWAAFTLYGGW